MRNVWAVVLLALPLALPRPAAAQQYAFRHYGAEAGMPVAYALAFDGAGSLLVGTNDGVVRFDGRGFEPVPLPVEGVVWRLTAAPDGAVWGLTTDGELFRLAPDGTASRIPTPAPLRMRLHEQTWPIKLRADGRSGSGSAAATARSTAGSRSAARGRFATSPARTSSPTSSCGATGTPERSSSPRAAG